MGKNKGATLSKTNSNIPNKSKTNNKKNDTLKYIKQHKWLYIMLIPGIIYFLIFRFGPMGGIIIAFQQYSPFSGILGSKWVGLEHFKTFLGGNDFALVLKNTLGISILNLLIYFPAPIILALLLNEIRLEKFKRLSQTFLYIPHFVSWVVVASLTYTLLNTNDGIINMIIQELTGYTVRFLSKPEYFKGMIVGQSIWKETGYGTIIFLAALSGVDPEQYEAAKIDGAGRWRLMWHITLPAIKGTIITMFILRCGSILNTGYEQIFLLQNDLNRSAAEVFDTYIYKKGILNAQYSFSTAAGLFKSIVGLVLVVGANSLSKKVGEKGIY